MPTKFNGLKGFYGHLLALLAGLIAPFGFAPFQYWPVSILSCLLFLYSLTSVQLKTACFRGWLYGVGFFGIGVSWVYVSINQFGHAAPWLAGLLTFVFVCCIALFFALQGAFYRVIAGSQSNNWLMWLGFPATWVLAEWFRSWFLTGFPWNYLGYAPIDSWLGSWAPITGVYGISFITALLASSIYLLLQRPKQTLLIATLAGLILPSLIGLIFAQQSWTQPSTAAPLKVALIQGNTPQNLKWNPGFRQRIIDGYIKATLMNLDTDLIIWPETAIPRLLNKVRPALTPLEELLSDSGTGLITGIPTQLQTSITPQKQYFNSIVGLASAEGIYHKQRLVPFGEYVPMEKILRGLITFFDLPMSSFSLGPADQQPLRLNNGQQLASFVCYEIVYPDLVANDSRNADYLLTLSNDSWFGDSLAPHQHLQMARMRAKENGRYLIRGTNNGISAIVDAHGGIVSQTGQFVTEVLRGEVQAMTGNTPFSRYGSTPIVALCLLICAALFASNRAKLHQHAPKTMP